MEKETLLFFKGKYVKLERLRPTDNRPFKLFGIIEKITTDSVILQSKSHLGAIRLCDILSVEEWDE